LSWRGLLRCEEADDNQMLLPRRIDIADMNNHDRVYKGPAVGDRQESPEALAIAGDNIESP
jgi:hypothetical protein